MEWSLVHTECLLGAIEWMGRRGRQSQQLPDDVEKKQTAPAADLGLEEAVELSPVC